MSRKRKAPIREVLSDPIFNSKIVTKLINTIMLDGRRATGGRSVYAAFERVKEKASEDRLVVFQKAVENVTPLLEVRTRRIGGTNYQVPSEVSARRKQTLALRWLINYARIRTEKTMDVKLANEIIEASKGTGGAVKKKEDTHKMAEANKAFAHFRW